ncbi:MFS transporter [Candidatus Roizmanbacteria bacterium]|nr:MFS transporter [Candidatus Roizmanbacteria bacterium]
MKNKLTQIFTLHFFNDGFLASIILLLPFIAKDLSLSLTQVGFLGSIFSVSGIILSLPVGFISSRFGAIRVLTVALLFYGLGFLLTSLSHSYTFLIIAFSIAAISFGVFHPVSFSLVTRLSKKETLGRIMGDFMATGEFGRICLSGFLSFIAFSIGWRQTSLIYVVISGLLLLIFFFFNFSQNQININENMETTPQEQINFIKIMKNKSFVLALFINFFDNLASSPLFIFLPFLLISKGINPSILGAFTTAFFIGNLIGKMALGRLTDKYKNTNVFIVAELLMIIFIILLAYSNLIFFIILFSIILGSLTMGTSPIRTTMITESNEHHGSYEKAFGISSFIASISSALAPIILGYVADLYGIVNSFNLTAVFAFLAVVSAYLYGQRKKSIIISA